MEYRVPQKLDGVPVQTILRQTLGLSSTSVKKLRKGMGLIRCDGLPVRTVDPVRAGQLLCFSVPETQESMPASYEGPLLAPVIYEDQELMAFDKPADMPVHPSRGHQQDTLANVFAALMRQRGECRPFRALNRLDRDTSGLCLVAKTAHGAYRVAGSLEKEYLAVIQGRMEPPHGVIDLPISRKDPVDILRQVDPNGQRAVTHYRTQRHEAGLSELRIRLETGRTHQIRVHLSYLGHPLVGDLRYGGDGSLLHRQALHCSRLWFQNEKGERVCLESMPEFLPLLFPIESPLCHAGEKNFGWTGKEKGKIGFSPKY